MLFKKRRVSPSDGSSPQRLPPSCVHILDLPPDTLLLILQYCSYREQSHTLRLVCAHFRQVCTTSLNSMFWCLRAKLERTIKRVDKELMTSPTDEYQLLLCRSHNALDVILGQVYEVGPDLYLGQGSDVEVRVFLVLHGQDSDVGVHVFLVLHGQDSDVEYYMVRAVTWRYMAPHLPDYAPLCCFYGGELLDEFLRLVALTRVDPKALGLDYLYSDTSQSTVGRLTHISRRFMNFFEKNTEKTLNTHYTVSGAKVHLNTSPSGRGPRPHA
uniref:F-box domain-containing protein n=1 Tax=Timema poppense TaxID=170557 RepID=A0A7R9D5X0_TIMPO|nr:unnamed protein product [Timema poppensis]